VRDYATPAAFRAAVEARLRERARRLGVPTYVVRRQAALERLMARLSKVAAGRWALKGGFALETRLGERARASLDLDAEHRQGAEAARADLQRAAIEDVGDHFAFAVVGSEVLAESMCANEAEQHDWRGNVLGFIRDHIESDEVYRLGEADLTFAELLPEKPEWLAQQEYEERTSVGFHLGRLATRIDRLALGPQGWESAGATPSDADIASPDPGA